MKIKAVLAGGITAVGQKRTTIKYQEGMSMHHHNEMIVPSAVGLIGRIEIVASCILAAGLFLMLF